MSVPAPQLGSIQVPSGRAPNGERATETVLVTPATLADAPAIITVVSQAFLHDPTWSWAFPEPAARAQWWAVFVAGALRYPWVLRTGAFEAVALWIPPGGTELAPADEAQLPALLSTLVGSRDLEVLQLLQRFEEAHPRHEPHYYLSLLATADAHRGRGLGFALLAENLARFDREGRPAYLESSNPANDARYAALGFTPVATFRAPGNGPLVTGMWRSPRAVAD